MNELLIRLLLRRLCASCNDPSPRLAAGTGARRALRAVGPCQEDVGAAWYLPALPGVPQVSVRCPPSSSPASVHAVGCPVSVCPSVWLGGMWADTAGRRGSHMLGSSLLRVFLPNRLRKHPAVLLESGSEQQD